MTANPRRTILDTNVVVAGCIRPDSTPAQAMARAFRSGRVLVSAATVEEIESVLRRARFDRYRDLDERLRYLRAFLDASSPVIVHEQLQVCRDPADNIFLELALSAKADVIVTGDADLLSLHPWRGIAILSPADYLAQSGEPG